MNKEKISIGNDMLRRIYIRFEEKQQKFKQNVVTKYFLEKSDIRQDKQMENKLVNS